MSENLTAELLFLACERPFKQIPQAPQAI